MTSSLAFVTARRAWAVGSEGDYESAIVKTTDGGLNWSWQDSDTVQYLLGADFLNATHGWVCGSRGTLLQTTDGGRTWSGKRGASVTDLWSVDFTDAAHGWVAGGNAGKTDGVIRHTSDGGATWTTQVTTPGAIIYKVAGLDGSQAWAVGGSPVSGAGIIIHTSDGGLTWQPQYGGPAIPWLCDATFRRRLHGRGRGRARHGPANGGRRPDLDHRHRADARGSDGGVVHGRRQRLDRRRRYGDAAHNRRRPDLDDHAQHIARFVCRLPRGAYRFSVYARDEAGNAQTRVGSNVLTVK